MKTIVRFKILLNFIIFLFAFKVTNGQINTCCNTVNSSNQNSVIGAYNTVTAGSYGSFASGYTNTIGNTANASNAFGDHCQVFGGRSFAAGYNSEARNNQAFSLGWNIKTTATNA